MERTTQEHYKRAVTWSPSVLLQHKEPKASVRQNCDQTQWIEWTVERHSNTIAQVYNIQDPSGGVYSHREWYQEPSTNWNDARR